MGEGGGRKKDRRVGQKRGLEGKREGEKLQALIRNLRSHMPSLLP